MTPMERAVWTWRYRNRARYLKRVKPEPPSTFAVFVGSVPWEDSFPHEELLMSKCFPAGHVDGIGRWWPAPCEVEACCREYGRTKFPGMKWPKTRALWMHCCSYRHVATKFSVSAYALRRQVQALDVVEALRS